MFGLVRTLWASMVVVGHIFWVGDFGRFAVFGFYILSGYLMTYVMHNSYGYSITSKVKFATNRFLRLYPAYWVACIITLLLLYFLGPFQQGSLTTMAMPDTLQSVLSNATMIFPNWIPHQVYPRLSPATWALTVELFFYALIALGVSKTATRTYIWVTISLVYIIASYAMGLFWHARYFSIPAGSLPFSLGALIFFLIKDKKTALIPSVLLAKPWQLFIIMFSIALVTSFLIPRGLPILLTEIIFYICMCVSFLLVLTLAMGEPFIKNFPKKLDKKLGDFSYPFYLLHYQAAIITSYLLFNQVIILKHQISVLSVFCVFFILILFTLAINIGIDHPIEKIRKKIRKS